MVNGIFDEDAIFEELSNESLSKQNLLAKRTDIKEKLIKRLDRYGIYDLFRELEDIDPISAQKYNDKNPVRVIRALEFYYLFNKPISQFHTNSIKNKYKVIYFQIDIDRESLYNKINKRTEIMLEKGWIEEVKEVLEMGYDYKLNSLNTVGYKEIIDYLDEDSEFYNDEDYLIDKIQQKTRNYAKRQITWFKKYANDSIYVKSVKNVQKELQNILNELT
jgi:tRNA dimethylallyltransferase